METIRTLKRNELDTLLDWAASEGWNPGLDDAGAFHAADPNGFIGAFVDDTLAAGVSVVRSGQSDGFLGLYICNPDHRAQGHGWRVWQAGMKYLDNRTIGLDGVVDQQDNYRRSGFNLAYRNIRFQGTPNQAGKPLRAPFQIRSMRASDMADVLQLDLQVQGVARRAFMNAWLDSNVTSRCTVVLTNKEEIQGFGTIRKCRNQYKIGPLIIGNLGSSKPDDRATAATSMICELVSRLDAEEIILDVPEPNDSAMAVARQLGLNPVFETARMYRGQAPAIEVQNIFGVTTLELG